MTLTEFFKENKKAAIAFSGGVDSAYLLCAALKSGADVSITAYSLNPCPLGPGRPGFKFRLCHSVIDWF